MNHNSVQTRRLLICIFGTLAIIKAVYLLEYSNLPFLYGPICDSLMYLRQAHQIRSGNFGDASIIAFSPLYGYFLALLGGGVSLGIPVLLQLLLGLFNVGLLFWITARLFNAQAGIIAAIMYGTYGTLLFFETKILSETLSLTLLLVATALYFQPEFENGQWRSGLLSGVFIALSVLARASLIFTIPFYVGASLLSWSRAPLSIRIRTKRTFALVLGIGGVLLGNGLWNMSNTGFFIPVILVSDTVRRTTTINSEEKAENLLPTQQDGPIDPGDGNALDVLGQAQSKMDKQYSTPQSEHGIDAPAFGIDLYGWLTHIPERTVNTISDSEIIYQYYYYGERSEMTALGLLPNSFGLILLLGTLGLARLIWDRGVSVIIPYMPIILGCLVTTTLYHPSTRYRLGMVIPLMILAGHGISLPGAFKAARSKIVSLSVLVALCAGFSIYTWTASRVHPAIWQLNLAQSYLVSAKHPMVKHHMELANRYAPRDPAIQSAIKRLKQGLAEDTARKKVNGSIQHKKTREEQ